MSKKTMYRGVYVYEFEDWAHAKFDEVQPDFDVSNYYSDGGSKFTLTSYSYFSTCDGWDSLDQKEAEFDAADIFEAVDKAFDYIAENYPMWVEMYCYDDEE